MPRLAVLILAFALALFPFTGLWEEAGCILDPGGCPVPSQDEGCGIDPGGGACPDRQ